MSRHGIQPNRELGQNFLVDDNMLEVIGRVAELDPSDVVLEIGGGLGVLSAYLAPRVRHLHVVETDAKLEPVLREALDATAATPRSDRGRDEAATSAASTRARQGGREPALRRRDVRRSCARSRSCPRSTDWMRDGAARDRRPARGLAGHQGLRHPVRARAARLRGGVRAPDLAQRLPPAAERRLGARAAAPHRAGRVGRRSPTSCAPRSRTGARRCRARSRRRAGRRASATRRDRGARGAWATGPTRAPRRLSPDEFVQLARDLERFG